ncbi:MAG: hypothetical protein ACREDR_41390, partial [Blastocatellia bacterium]
ASGLRLGGTLGPEGMHVTTAGDLDRYLRPFKVITEALSVEHLRRSARLANALALVFANERSDDYLRLRKGFNLLLVGMKESVLYTRLHHFVRAI